MAMAPTTETAVAAVDGFWYQGPQLNPTRPAIPSVILTVNQVR